MQGSAADVIKRALVTLQRHLAADAERSATLVLSVWCSLDALHARAPTADPHAPPLTQVHDDAVLEVDAAALPRVAALVRSVMVGAGVAAGVTVPLAVRLRAGPNWHDLVDLD